MNRKRPSERGPERSRIRFPFRARVPAIGVGTIAILLSVLGTGPSQSGLRHPSAAADGVGPHGSAVENGIGSDTESGTTRADLRGKILRADGSPVAGHIVTVQVAITSGPQRGSALGYGRTDSRGEFDIREVPQGRCELCVQMDDPAPGQDPSEGSYCAASFESERWPDSPTLTIPSGVEISGCVRCCSGRTESRLRVSLAPLEEAAPPRLALVAVTVADPDGSFRFSSVPRGRYLLIAHRELDVPEPAQKPLPPSEAERSERIPGACTLSMKRMEALPRSRGSRYVTARSVVDVDDEPRTGLEVGLDSGGCVGRIHADGADVLGASVLFLDIDAPAVAYAPRFLPGAACAAFTSTDARGGLALPGLPEGRYRIRVTGERVEDGLNAEGAGRLRSRERCEIVLGPSRTLILEWAAK